MAHRLLCNIVWQRYSWCAKLNKNSLSILPSIFSFPCKLKMFSGSTTLIILFLNDILNMLCMISCIVSHAHNYLDFIVEVCGNPILWNVASSNTHGWILVNFRLIGHICSWVMIKRMDGCLHLSKYLDVIDLVTDCFILYKEVSGWTDDSEEGVYV